MRQAAKASGGTPGNKGFVSFEVSLAPMPAHLCSLKGGAESVCGLTWSRSLLQTPSKQSTCCTASSGLTSCGNVLFVSVEMICATVRKSAHWKVLFETLGNGFSCSATLHQHCQFSCCGKCTDGWHRLQLGHANRSRWIPKQSTPGFLLRF